MRTKKLLIVSGLLLLLLTACGGQPRDPGAVIEDYMTALVARDDAQAITLSCAAWEENASADGASFEGVEANLESISCGAVDENGDEATVSCEGQIVFSYAGGEDEVYDLSLRNYSVVLEGGEWRMCGYK